MKFCQLLFNRVNLFNMCQNASCCTSVLCILSSTVALKGRYTWNLTFSSLWPGFFKPCNRILSWLSSTIMYSVMPNHGWLKQSNIWEAKFLLTEPPLPGGLLPSTNSSLGTKEIKIYIYSGISCNTNTIWTPFAACIFKRDSTVASDVFIPVAFLPPIEKGAHRGAPDREYSLLAIAPPHVLCLCLFWGVYDLLKAFRGIRVTSNIQSSFPCCIRICELSTLQFILHIFVKLYPAESTVICTIDMRRYIILVLQNKVFVSLWKPIMPTTKIPHNKNPFLRFLFVVVTTPGPFLALRCSRWHHGHPNLFPRFMTSFHWVGWAAGEISLMGILKCFWM